MGYLLSLQPTFTQGLVVGQLSIIILLVFVLKYLFFVSDPSSSHHLPTTTISRSLPNQDTPPRERSNDSLEWLNVILAEIVETYRLELRSNHAGPEGDESTRAKIEKKLNEMRPPAFVDPILVHSVNLGSSAPHLSNVHIDSTQTSLDSQQIEFDMTYTDNASISFSTSIFFNYPFPYFARVPVSLTLSLSLFSSKILLTLPDPKSKPPTITFSLAPSFTLDLHISSLLGSRAKLADVPKVHDMIRAQIKKILVSRGTWTVALPSISPPPGWPDVRYTNDEIDLKLVNEGLGRPPDMTIRPV